MYINRIDPQLNNRSVSKKRRRLKREGDGTFSEEVESLLDVVSIEHVDPNGKKHEKKHPTKERLPADEDSGERKIDIVC